MFLIHCWPHDNKLGESNCLTSYPLSCLFSRVVKYDERENVGSGGSAFIFAKKTAMAWNKKSFNADSPFIAEPGMFEMSYETAVFFLFLFSFDVFF